MSEDEKPRPCCCAAVQALGARMSVGTGPASWMRTFKDFLPGQLLDTSASHTDSPLLCLLLRALGYICSSPLWLRPGPPLPSQVVAKLNRASCFSSMPLSLASSFQGVFSFLVTVEGHTPRLMKAFSLLPSTAPNCRGSAMSPRQRDFSGDPW